MLKKNQLKKRVLFSALSVFSLLAVFFFYGCTQPIDIPRKQKPVTDTPGPVLFAPSVIRGDKKLSVSWIAESGFEYEVFYRKDAASENPKKCDAPVTQNGSVASVEISGLDNGSAYYVRLSRKNSGDETELSEEIRETPEAPPSAVPETEDFAYVPGGTVIGSGKWAFIVTVPENSVYHLHGQTFEKKGVFVEGRKIHLDSFYMAKYETTRELWYNVQEWGKKNKSYFFQNEKSVPAGADADKPVTNINWRDAVVWCNAYSEMSGLDPVYYYEGDVIKDSRNDNSTACDGAVMNTSKNGYRLPADTEREYAARGGDPAKEDWMFLYAGSNNADSVAWYHGNSPNTIQPVEKKKSNRLGIFDLSGNAQEWGWDWMYFDITVPWDTPWDGAAYSRTFSQKSLAGGGVRSNITMSCVAYQWSTETNYQDCSTGFRVVRKVDRINAN